MSRIIAVLVALSFGFSGVAKAVMLAPAPGPTACSDPASVLCAIDSLDSNSTHDFDRHDSVKLNLDGPDRDARPPKLDFH